MKVDIKKVYSENEERAEIHVVILTEEIQNAVDILENNKRRIPIMHFTRGISSFEMPWYIPLTIPFTAFLCALPSALINDCDGLTKRQIRFRIFLHFICLRLVVSICGFVFGWYSQRSEYTVIMVVYLIIYLSVWLISWWLGKRDEEIINQVLNNIHDTE